MSQIITIQNLRKRFGDQAVLKGLNLNVPQGSVYALLGNNGAGKSTTLRILLGLVDRDDGDVSVLGLDPAHDRVEMARRIGGFVEAPALYPRLTAHETLAMCCRLRRLPHANIGMALERCGLTGVGTKLVANFSMGMRQRLCLAQALIGEPELIVLDEPINGLDPEGILEMRSFIRSLPEQTGATVLLSSHLLNEVEQTATHVGMLVDGTLRVEAPLDNLLARDAYQLHLRVSDLDKARACLVPHWPLEQESDGLIVTIETEQEAAEINRKIVCSKLELIEARLMQPSLEKIFHKAQLNESENMGTAA